MGTYAFTVDIAAPRDQVWALWTDLDRAQEWIEGMARISDLSGPIDQVGTTYKVYFGSWSTSTTTILEAEPPRYLKNRFGNWFLRGEQSALLDETPGGTRLTQTFTTRGIIPAITGWIFSRGSYKGSFSGELATFKEICEREASARNLAR
jgi:uncharacterized protein YndB with AHSA1/START domain